MHFTGVPVVGSYSTRTLPEIISACRLRRSYCAPLLRTQVILPIPTMIDNTIPQILMILHHVCQNTDTSIAFFTRLLNRGRGNDCSSSWRELSLNPMTGTVPVPLHSLQC